MQQTQMQRLMHYFHNKKTDRIMWIIRILLISALAIPSLVSAQYEAKTANGVHWLVAKQNQNGSWGTDNQNYLYTSLVVTALRGTGYRKTEYYRGITWLENHAANNNDYLARRATVLFLHGDFIREDITLLEGQQDTTNTGKNGWGLTSNYLQSPLDTAIVLQSFNTVTTIANVQATIDYLKTSQSTTVGDQGWSIGNSNSSDTFTTSMVIKALVPLQSVDASLSAVITNAITALKNNIGVSTPLYLKAYAAQAAWFANDTSTALTWLNELVLTQSQNGDWSNDIYTTALAISAFATADGTDATSFLAPIAMPDAQLRAAINAALGRNAMDNLTAADMLRLTTLNASGLGIDNLMGLEYAVNLVQADLTNNNITTFDPIAGLSSATFDLNNNPGSLPPNIASIPTLPEWAFIVMSLFLLLLMLRHHIVSVHGSTMRKTTCLL